MPLLTELKEIQNGTCLYKYFAPTALSPQRRKNFIRQQCAAGSQLQQIFIDLN
jgi:hypothetical protein